MARSHYWWNKTILHHYKLAMKKGDTIWWLRFLPPLGLRAKVLKEPHQSHPGTSQMKSQRGSYISTYGSQTSIHEIEKIVKSSKQLCKGCKWTT